MSGGMSANMERLIAHADILENLKKHTRIVQRVIALMFCFLACYVLYFFVFCSQNAGVSSKVLVS